MTLEVATEGPSVAHTIHQGIIMFKLFLKVGAVLLAIAGLFKALQIYALLQFGQNIQDCGLKEKVCPLVAQRADASRIGTELNATFACVAQRQSLLEALVLPVKKQVSPSSLQGPVPYAEADKLCAPHKD